MHVFLAPLTFLGRHGTLAIALSLLVGTALPFLSAVMRPFLDEAILTLLTLAFLRIGFRAVGNEFKSPLPVIIATVIAMLVMPALAFWIAKAFGFDESHPGLYLALFIALAVPPITAVPIFASLLRLPGAIALAFLILCMAATPFVATLHARLFFSGQGLPFDGMTIGLRLAGFMAGAIILATIIKQLIGEERLERHRTTFDGINVLVMLVFAIAVMDGFGPAIVTSPGLVASLFVATFALATAQMAVMRTALFFLPTDQAMSIAFATGLRNMGLMVAALGLAIPETTWLWFAVGQFPIYFMPWFIELARRQRQSSQLTP
ncbi:sodium:proton symporter [Ahrensia marina]|uniref:sodium:proton symporter n=1 Tax=Ahrensia marina TaxID=1514904 RepID=UPI0035D09D97